MIEIIYGIVAYLVVGVMTIILTYALRKETLRIVEKQADMFPPPYSKIAFSALSGLLVVLFPIVLATQVIHIINKRLGRRVCKR